jgi:hypothetical protein
MNFQFTVIIVATIILILMLTFVGYALYNNRFNKQFPPVIGECPDYWVSQDNQCTNPRNLGTCTGPTNFNTKQYKGHDGNKLKSQWAKNCNLTWDGITNTKV